jgi:hypothetical protein
MKKILMLLKNAIEEINVLGFKNLLPVSDKRMVAM